MKYFFSCLILFIVCEVGASAQSTASTLGITAMGSSQFDTTGFPLWAKDLRRAEIVAFGSFPFTMLFSSLAIESYRFISHDWDSRYAPQFFRSAGGVELTEDEQMLILTVAAMSSIVISLADFIIVQYKRYKQRQYYNNLPGTPIIIRKPWPEQQAADTSLIEDSPAGSGEP